MEKIANFVRCAHYFLFEKNQFLNGIPLLGIRLFLAPIMIVAGWTKFENFDSNVAWFESSLHLPLPGLMVFLAASAELVGGILLLIGLAVRWASIPLTVTMLVAIFTVHWGNGWFAIAQSNPNTSPARVVALLPISGARESLANSEKTSEQLSEARRLLRMHGDYEKLSRYGNFVILNNGIEFAATYLLMLLVLIFYGGGQISIDHSFRKHYMTETTKSGKKR